MNIELQNQSMTAKFDLWWLKDKLFMVPSKMSKSCTIYNMLSFVYNTDNVGPIFLSKPRRIYDRGIYLPRYGLECNTKLN
jgi:hypothetical protein